MGQKGHDLAEAFHGIFHTQPDGMWAAPGRVNLIGEHTDYNDGLVLPFALNVTIMAAVARRTDGLLRIASRQRDGIVELRVDELSPGFVSGWSAYVAGVVWALRRAGHTVAGYDILVDGDVPVGAGLSSSAALECATALAIAEIEGVLIERLQLALLAQGAENDFVGVPSGMMDQAASLLCTANSALFLDVRSRAYDQIPLQLDRQGLALIVADTRTRHRLTDGAYADRRRRCEEAAQELGLHSLREIPFEELDRALSALSSDELRMRVRHVVSENERVVATVSILRDGRPAELGPVLSRSHASLRDDFQVSSRELDLAVEAAMNAGALGARMTGAGFGGCIVAVVEQTQTQAIGNAISTAFRLAGFSAPHSFTAVPAEGARRVN